VYESKETVSENRNWCRVQEEAEKLIELLRSRASLLLARGVRGVTRQLASSSVRRQQHPQASQLVFRKQVSTRGRHKHRLDRP